MSVSRPKVLGGSIAVPNSGQLAIMSATGLPIGTRVWNDGVGSFFTLHISTAALDPNVVVAVADTVGSRWLLDTSDSEVASVTGNNGVTVDNSDQENPVVGLSTVGAETVLGSVAGGVPAALARAQLTALINPSTALLAGSESVANFDKLATVPTGVALSPAAFTVVVDLTAAAASYELIPACPFRFYSGLSINAEIKSTNTVSVAPTLSIGSNSASFSNLYASQTPAAFTTQAVETGVALTAITPRTFVDLTASGLRVNVTNPATAVALTARFVIIGQLIPV